MKTEIKLEIAKIVKKGYGKYFVWIAYCKKCRRFRPHYEPFGMSYYQPTCSKGHYSEGNKLKAIDLKRILKRKNV